MKAKYKRLLWIILAIISIFIGLAIILSQFQKNIVFFYTPHELENFKSNDQQIRVGGIVKSESIIKNINNTITHRFTITDNIQDLIIEYQGILPNLFRENQGIIAKGKYDQLHNKFNAVELLAKHDEKYMPKEIADKLKEQGLYKPQK